MGNYLTESGALAWEPDKPKTEHDVAVDQPAIAVPAGVPLESLAPEPVNVPADVPLETLAPEPKVEKPKK